MYRAFALVVYTFLIVVVLVIFISLSFLFLPSFLIGLVIVWLLAREMGKLLRQGSYRATKSGFEQNGVAVDYDGGTIVINGQRYTANDLTGQLGISWNRNSSVVEIHTRDIGKPIQRIHFVGIHAKRDGEDFIARFKAAVGNMASA